MYISVYHLHKEIMTEAAITYFVGNNANVPRFQGVLPGFSTVCALDIDITRHHWIYSKAV